MVSKRSLVEDSNMQGFIHFIREQGVVGLAIGFILGGAVSKLVTSLVQDILQPLLGLVIGRTDELSSLSLGHMAYGHFLVSLIDFTVVAAVVYFIFRGLKLNKLDVGKS